MHSLNSKTWVLLMLLTPLFFLRPVSARAFGKNELSFLGRFRYDRDFPAADWSGSSINIYLARDSFVQSENSVVNMTLYMDTTVAVSGADMLYYVGVLLNCQVLGTYEVSANNNMINLSFPADISDSLVELNIIKLTESSYSDSQGEMAVVAYDLSHNAKVVTQNNLSSSCRNPNNLRILTIGDSITAAYGVDGVNPCTYSASTQNFLHSYAFLVAESLGADLHTVAWSGKGVVRNYGDPNPTSTDPMPAFYNRTFAPISIADDSKNYWDPNAYTPDVVLVMLGSNDYSTTPVPSDEDFVNGLISFLNLITSDYPTAAVAAMCAPRNHGNQCINIQTAADATGSTYVGMNSSLYVEPDGCDSHPSIATQQNIAEVVIPVVQDMLRNK